MPDDPSSEINHLLEKFKSEFTVGSKPEISDYVLQVAESQREELARELISAEVILRIKAGEQTLNASDYQSLGDFAAEHAANEIKQQIADEVDLKTIDSPTPPFGAAQTPRLDDSRHSSDKRQIGPYKLLQQIGEGGMGMVWMAEQEKPVRRRVALKLIKGAIADKQIIARFEAERQALAMMDHQNIAKVLDAGTTETGNPYFVMELVQGIPINEYCDRNKLTPNERLELFVPVCKAVQHAHQKGIIHRDLKPSNVLVQLYDGKPIAKVIDFGLDG